MADTDTENVTHDAEDTEKKSDHDSDECWSDEPSEENLEFDYYDKLEITWALLAWDKHIKEYTEKNRSDFIVNYMKSQRERYPRRCTNCHAIIRYDMRFCDGECQYENAHKDPGW